MLWIISFSREYKVLFAIQWSHRISVNLFCVNWCPIATAAGGACLASSYSFASVFAESQQHHVMTSIWIKIPHQNGNEMKGRKTISKKNEQEFRWISGKCLLCCHNANYTQIYMLHFARLLDAVVLCEALSPVHLVCIVRVRVAFWLELLIYFDWILNTKLEANK